ncbi:MULTISPECIES: diacylglycerol kinase [Peptoniphilus]|uniref:Prokaryotic diacylglycerol kinase n=1 Tax=Peptoniphilus lacrimalis 315-B TaxID=596330 RepID=D1VTF5_9FIRM|nr:MULTISPECIES: diacylglycerol kinase [Peptoniphilus]EFA90163.1 prokaryotic diacylglycerol kinase [Peptoniphilus lacrimalis 315-B]EFK39243.1 prokaryotic diacylglycerol kinase [Peptoniphilus sp. oral taxon 836 str. F0141]KGF36558.1 diacylglycerol kinase [Peptoniphilus lacrimalis DNF00528]MDK8282097.1 diacylglycerol kinase [Peptoniphilus lacrimalis]
MKNFNFISSFNYAIQGIVSVLKTEKNMKFHYLTALLVVIFSLFFNISSIEFMIILFSIILVVFAEMVNTAIERTVDLVVQDYNPIAKYVKDVSAGAVLITAINAIVCAYLIFYEKFASVGDLFLFKIKNSDNHLAFVCLFLVVALTIGGKFLLAKKNGGTYFQGGAVSGHCAIAFCAATIISMVAENSLVTTASFGLALLVGESRVEGKIHTMGQVISGSILGICVAIFIFKVIG